MTPFRAALIASLVASPAFAQSARGTWDGFAYTGNSSQKITVALDSAAAGWKGTVVSSMDPNAVQLTTVTLKADTLSFGIPYNGTTVWIQGLVAGAKFSATIWVGNDNVGTMELTKKAAEADKPTKPGA